MISTRVHGRRHVDALEASSFLAADWYHAHRPGAIMVVAKEVIGLLRRARIKFIVMGTHGVGGWRSEPRATRDVDFLVALKDYEKSIGLIRDAYPKLTVIEAIRMTRFRDETTGHVVIDVMKPVDDLFRLAFRHTVAVGRSHRVPDLELALVCKFAAMLSPHRREEKKFIDAGDFIDIAKHNDKEIDVRKLKRLAEKVYKGGGAEIAKMIADIRAGRRIKI